MNLAPIKRLTAAALSIALFALTACGNNPAAEATTAEQPGNLQAETTAPTEPAETTTAPTEPPTTAELTTTPTTSATLPAYEVVSGDSWYGIAERFGLDATELADANDRSIDDIITIGELLLLPPNAVMPGGYEARTTVVTEEPTIHPAIRQMPLPDTYDVYATSPSPEALAKYDALLSLDYWNETELLQVGRVPTFIEYLVRKEDGQPPVTDADISDTFRYDDSMPYFIQWDARWAWQDYAGSKYASSGCGPAALASVYVDRTGDRSMNPARMGDLATENGYALYKNGSAWALMDEGAAKLGLNVATIGADEQSAIAALERDEPVMLIMGPGVFTSTGHFIILRDYTDGQFLIYDPFNPANANKGWDWSEFGDQIRGAWAYPALG